MRGDEEVCKSSNLETPGSNVIHRVVDPRRQILAFQNFGLLLFTSCGRHSNSDPRFLLERIDQATRTGIMAFILSALVQLTLNLFR